MFKAGVEGGLDKNNEQFKHAYDEMSAALKKRSNMSNKFVEGFIKTYHLDQITSLMQEEVTQSTDMEKFLYNENFNLKAQEYQYAGVTMEYFGEYAMNIVANSLKGVHGSESMPCHFEGARHTGGTRAKPDFMATAGVSLNVIDKWLKNNKFGSREKNVAAAKEL